MFMCRKLNEISGLTANQILSYFGNDSYPVDITKILDNLQIMYGPMNFSPLEEQARDLIKEHGRILGAVTVLGDDIAILYSQGSTENRLRFTLAHELAHCCLDAQSLFDTGHIEFRFDEISDDIKEKTANTFAGELLIPKNHLLKMYSQLVIPASDIMAQEFKVSVPVMEARLKCLNLNFYSPNKLEKTGEF